MPLFTPGEVRRYRYQIAQCTLIFGGETVNVRPEAVGGLMIEEQFATDLYPVLRINIATNEETYYKIGKNKTTMRVHLKINSYYGSMDGRGNIVNKSAKKVWIDEDFCTISRDVNINRKSDLDRAAEKKNVNQGDADERKCVSELYLWSVSVANGFKKIINVPLKDTTIGSVIVWALGNAGISNGLVSPLENSKRYKDIFIPPLSIDRLLQHLDAMYGFYKYGSMIYFGIKHSYILNFNGKCTVWARGETKNVTILIPKITVNESSGDGGTVYRGDAVHYIYARYQDVDFSSPSTVDNVVDGTDAVAVTKTSSNVSRAKAKSRSTNDKNNTAVISNSTENEWIAQTYAAQKSSKKCVLTCMLKNVNIADLTPNKLFTVAVEDPAQTKNAKGNYKLFSAIHRFNNDSANGDFALESAVEFRKMEEPG